MKKKMKQMFLIVSRLFILLYLSFYNFLCLFFWTIIYDKKNKLSKTHEMYMI